MEKNFFGRPTLGDMTRRVLEDFETIATMADAALVPGGHAHSTLRENVAAAVKATTLRLSSIDYAKRRYGEVWNDGSTWPEATLLYTQAYFLAKTHIAQVINALETDGRPEPRKGVFCASVVLERLPISFFSAHLLYRLGHRYEANAVARLILEQIAWAYAAYAESDEASIEAISPTKAITKLKLIDGSVGRFYGVLSDKTHIAFSSHLEFLKIENDVNVVYFTQSRMGEYAEIILKLADLFAIVWEISQQDYLNIFHSTRLIKDMREAKKSRSFLKAARKLVRQINAAERPRPTKQQE